MCSADTLMSNHIPAALIIPLGACEDHPSSYSWVDVESPPPPPIMMAKLLFVTCCALSSWNAQAVMQGPSGSNLALAFSRLPQISFSSVDNHPNWGKNNVRRRSAFSYPGATSTPAAGYTSLQSSSSLRLLKKGRIQDLRPIKMVARSWEGGETAIKNLSAPAAAKLEEKGMTQKDWNALLDVGDVVSLQGGELLMSQGDVYEEPEERELYLVLSGECRLEVSDGAVARLLPGDFIGEASFTSGRLAPRTATVRAAGGKVEVVRWTWGVLRAFLAEPENARAKAALESRWMSGLAEKLADVMSALGGQSVVETSDEQTLRPGDYGYRYLEDTRDVETIIPVNIATLSTWSFAREYRSLRRTFRFGEFRDTWISGPFSQIDKFLETFIFPVLRPSRVDLPREPEVIELQNRLSQLKLSNKAIEDRENARIASTKELLEKESRKGLRSAEFIRRSQTPWFVMLPYKLLCWLLDVIFEDRPIQRFWFLETVARMPYFSYLSMLFFYETLGWWSGGAEVRRVHFAEEYNEMMHLRVMESLGGDTRWSDRFFARHAAIIYYWVLVVGYMVSPFLAYNFSELIESHAVDTYSEFLETNKELLKSLPPTPQALAYYQGGDMYLFDEFQTSRPAFSRRPAINSLYDVFRAIRDDELEHVKTMFACERGKGALKSPNAAAATPRWAEDATPGSGSSRGPFPDELRSDVLRKTPLERFTSAFNPLRKIMFGYTPSGDSASRVGSENKDGKNHVIGGHARGEDAPTAAVKGEDFDEEGGKE